MWFPEKRIVSQAGTNHSGHHTNRVFDILDAHANGNLPRSLLSIQPETTAHPVRSKNGQKTRFQWNLTIRIVP